MGVGVGWGWIQGSRARKVGVNGLSVHKSYDVIIMWVSGWGGGTEFIAFYYLRSAYCLESCLSRSWGQSDLDTDRDMPVTGVLVGGVEGGGSEK